MERAISTLNYLTLSRDNLPAFIQKAKEEILSGEEKAINVALMLKSVEEIVSSLRSDKDIRDFIVNEIIKYNGKFENDSAKMEIKETGTRYDYSACNDSQWENLNNQIIILTSKLKDREKFLKALHEEMITSDGEIIQPPVKSSVTNYTVTLK